MNWYIGQEIVCVNAHGANYIKSGKSYKIRSLRNSICKCNEVEIDVGINDTIQTTGCCKCKVKIINYSGLVYYSESRFAPLDQDISELTEILKKENVKSI